MPLFLALCASLSLALAWLTPASTLCAILSWLSALLYCAFFRSTGAKHRHIYLGGLLLHLIGFWWMVSTISAFGGFNWFETALIFGLFVTLSALQFPIWLWAANRLKGSALDQYYLIPALTWILSEQYSLRIFPWSLGHTQLGFLPFAQIAEIGGHSLIAFVMLWVCDAAVCSLQRQHARFRSRAMIFPAVALLLSIIFGSARIDYFNSLNGTSTGTPVSVALVQGNVTVEDKHDVKMFKVNSHRYAELSMQTSQPNQLTVWPESVLQEWISAKQRDLSGSSELRFAQQLQGPLLVGALTFNSEAEFFNSAVLVQADGSMQEPYHKQILMPFGEYTPFEKYMPWIGSIHETPDFTAGKAIKIFEVKSLSGHQAYSLSPLICYEDVVPKLSRDAVLSGAQILVNLTNDAWFGDSVAPFQHNLIASFRAIENRRYLLRSTNSGLTAVIDPIGRTSQSLPAFSEGVLKGEVYALQDLTFYTKYFNDRIYLALLLLWLFFAVNSRTQRAS